MNSSAWRVQALKRCLVEPHLMQKSSQEWWALGLLGLFGFRLPDRLGLAELGLLGRMDRGVLALSLLGLRLRFCVPWE